MSNRQIKPSAMASLLLPEDISGRIFDLNPNATGRCFSDDAATTAAVLDGTVAVLVEDVMGIVMRQTGAAARPLLREADSGVRYLESDDGLRRMISDTLDESILRPLRATPVTAVAWVWAALAPVATSERFFGLYATASANGAHQLSVRDSTGSGGNDEWLFRRYDGAATRTSNVLIDTYPGLERMTMMANRFHKTESWDHHNFINGARVARQATATETIDVNVVGLMGNATQGERIHAGGRVIRVVIWDHALTPGQLMRLYQGTKSAWQL